MDTSATSSHGSGACDDASYAMTRRMQQRRFTEEVAAK